MVVLICGDCGHATDVKDDAFAEEFLQLEVFHVPCKGTQGKGVMRRGEPFKHETIYVSPEEIQRAVMDGFPDYFVDVRETHDKDLIYLDGRRKEHA
ncbi:MAG: hypothetical protein KKG76_09360 [Euryarchaeota archaeon]|nr:hypothetical protein [Euryarchaeota archaeon]